MEETTPDTSNKALAINLDRSRYGTFAEIGAGQEVARWFFRVGGASGTIAKTMSAYDMQVSDAIYGKSDRYVSRGRLEAMLDHEYDLNVERLDAQRGEETSFFSFADTVAAQNFHGENSDCHGWMGIRFQATPRAKSSQILIHARMRDRDVIMQYEALGILGVNLVYGASRLCDSPVALLASLLDGLGSKRIEIDMVEFSGDCFKGIDNRVMSLRLVELGLTKAAMFAPTGAVLQPAEVLYKKPVLLQRGRFRPPTIIHADIQRRALERFSSESGVDADRIMPLLEISLRDLKGTTGVDVDDFVDRIHALMADDHVVLISDFDEYFRVAEFLKEHRAEQVALPLGAQNLVEIMREPYYEELSGGLLEATSRLFRDGVFVYVYPQLDRKTEERIELEDIELTGTAGMLLEYLVLEKKIQGLPGLPDEKLRIVSDDVLRDIAAGGDMWEDCVHPQVANVIKLHGLFGYPRDDR